MSYSWHVWSISNNKINNILEFLSSQDYLVDYLYPTLEKEYITNHGKRKRRVPLYSNYIFLYYKHNNDNYLQLKKCKWLSEYIGACSEDEMISVRNMDGKFYDNVVTNDLGVVVGMSVGLKYNNFPVVIEEINGNHLIVSIELFGQNNLIDCTLDDIYIL